MLVFNFAELLSKDLEHLKFRNTKILECPIIKAHIEKKDIRYLLNKHLYVRFKLDLSKHRLRCKLCDHDEIL